VPLTKRGQCFPHQRIPLQQGVSSYGHKLGKCTATKPAKITCLHGVTNVRPKLELLKKYSCLPQGQSCAYDNKPLLNNCPTDVGLHSIECYPYVLWPIPLMVVCSLDNCGFSSPSYFKYWGGAEITGRKNVTVFSEYVHLHNGDVGKRYYTYISLELHYYNCCKGFYYKFFGQF